MTSPSPLCVVSTETTESCCEATPQSPAAPVQPSNRSGLSAIQYRIGTFTSFRQAMLDRVASPDLLGAAVPNPFAAWRPRPDGDYQTMFVELWAYLADILTFYQERIVNEAFLPTATRRDSLQRLAALIGYRPGPGAGATALLAFTAEKGKSATVPARFRVGSRPAPGQTAAVFETAAAIVALGDYSAIPLSSVIPTNQFGQIGSFGSVFGRVSFTRAELVESLSDLYGSAGTAFLETLPRMLTTVSARPRSSVAAFRPVYVPYTDPQTRTIVLQGINNNLSPGNYILVVENEGCANADPTTGCTAAEQTTLQQVTTVKTDKLSGTTTITWIENPPASYQNVTLYAFRVTTGLFGNNAPNWNSLPTSVTSCGFYTTNWDDAANPATVPGGQNLYLDAIYSNVTGTADKPSWVVLSVDATTQVFHAIDARPLGTSGFAMSARVTRLTLREALPSGIFPVRGTVVLVGSQALPLQNNLPVADPLVGRTLVLAGLFPKLQFGQTVVIQGNVCDTTTVPPSQVIASESGVLAAAPVLDAVNNLTTVALKQALANPYVRATTSLLANVATATQGETVRDETLGSGDGSAFQAYPLKKQPLTYLPSTDPEGLTGAQSTLTVTVNGVTWAEHPTLLESAANDQVYTTTRDNTGQTTVGFGDGLNGARPPTGQANIHARYRKGLGTAGNVNANSIQQLIDSAPGLQKVTNPQPSFGGADPDSADQIRASAPASVLTFNRAVSATDYAALALTYPGVAKASAVWILHDPITLEAIPRPYVQLTVATADRVPLDQQSTFARNLRSFLDKRRDPNVPLRVIDFTPVYVDVAATIDVNDRYGRQATLNAAIAALSPASTLGFFAFGRRQFGESIHLSAVYAVLQAVPGVADTTITTLRRPVLDLDSTVVRSDIFVRPTELGTVLNDPSDTINQYGKVQLQLGQGGFDDT